MKNQIEKSTLSIRKSLMVGSAGACLLFALLASNTAKAQSLYFVGPTGGIANGGSYSWDDTTSWGATSGTTPGTGGGWTAGDFARFYGGSGDSYTVTVNADEQNTGLYNDNSTSTLTINSAGVGDDLDVITAIQGFLSTSGSSTIINSPIVGAGGVAPELSGSVSLFGVNTYTGGTALGDSGNTLTYFNNSSSFGSGGISLNRTGIANFSTLLSSGGSPITLANNFSTVSANTGSGTALNFASGANTPVNVSGTWTLGAVNLNLRNSGGSTAPLTLSGAISGTGLLALSANGSGNTTILAAASPSFTGTIEVTGAGGTYGGTGVATLQMAIANGISASSALIMAGGTFNAGGFYQVTHGTLGMTASSTLMFGATANTALSFGNSSGLTWTAGQILNLADWQGNSSADGGTSTDTLEIGTDATGLTSAQLADIEFDGSGLGTAAIDANGYIEQVPEPSTVVLGIIGGLALLRNIRRRMI